jgi:hypothetical protein
MIYYFKKLIRLGLNPVTLGATTIETLGRTETDGTFQKVLV